MKRLLLLCAILIGFAAWTWGQGGSSPGWGEARWIWDEADAHSTPQNDEPRFMRLNFDLSAKPIAAELWITADNRYVAYVNGKKVGEDDKWESVEKYDVTKHLLAGKNVLAIKATNAGGPAGAIARLHIKTADKKDLFVVTNDKTKMRRAEPRKGPEWTHPDFDDSAWANAIVLGDASIAPWNLANTPVANAPGSPKYGFNESDKKITKQQAAKDQLKHFVVPKDFEIELVADDPLIINPITMVVDDKGRIIVSESHTYRFGPPRSPIKPFANPVIRLDPDGKGGFERRLVADGFDDPVMGIAVKGDKLWLTANNYLYTYDIDEASRERKRPEKEAEKGIATNKKILLHDKTKAWNPFGMFVLEWGPDGKLYMSVGNHDIKIEGPDGKIASRGSSGMIMRMNPDGTKMERLTHGLRVPYSFEFDPFGQLWLLSNGEGNPDRLVRVIEGVDYHCYSRPGVNNDWLAGRHPLAPPCEEVHGGAHTQLLRYYAANFPHEYQGNLFACNWGRHGFAGANRGIFRFILDDRNNVVKKETLVACTDPHFRPSHIHLDVDGSLLIADWYGRDDESDKTGRIWRLKYVGKDRPVVKHKLDSPEWKKDDYAIEALGSPDHLVRAKAVQKLTKANTIANIGKIAAETADPLAAANALWTLVRTGTPEAFAMVPMGTKHKDWRVRSLTFNILGRLPGKFDDQAARILEGMVNSKLEKDPAVALSRAIAISHVHDDEEFTNFQNIGKMLLSADAVASKDPHLRYQISWHFAKYASKEALSQLLTFDDADVRLAGLITIDIACYENFPTKKAAIAALAKALENPGKLDHQLLLMVAQLDGDASIVPSLVKMLERDDLPTATIAKAYLVLKSKAGPSLALPANKIGKRIVETVEKGQLKIASPADQLVLFEFLESEGPTPFALKQIEGQLRSNNKELRLAAHTLARRFGPKASPLADGLWPSVLNPKTKFDDTMEYLSTIARVEKSPDAERWFKMLNHNDPFVQAETVRWWRNFKGRPNFVGLLDDCRPNLVKDANIEEDLKVVSRHLERKPPEAVNKDGLTKYALKELDDMPAGDRSKRAAMGLQVFERNSCTKCHTTATQTTLLAPSLKGVGTQKVEHLIESVLYPSKIIKTGWEVEAVELKSGKTLAGIVKDEGKHLRILNLDKDDKVLKTDVESRSQTKVSVMPDGQEATLSRREFVDLIAYLQTLK